MHGPTNPKSNFMKILPMGAKLVHSDRQTEMTNLIVAFGNFAKALKIIHYIFIAYFIIINLPLFSSSPKMYLSFRFP
jgi:accessory gene regulator protein AgrB